MVTFAEAKVDWVYRGSEAPPTISLVTGGGEIKGGRVFISGNPIYAEGMKAIMFLRQSSFAGSYFPVMGEKGFVLASDNPDFDPDAQRLTACTISPGTPRMSRFIGFIIQQPSRSRP